MSRRGRVLAGIAALLIVQAGAVFLYKTVQRARSKPLEEGFAVEALSSRPSPDLEFERSDRTRASLAQLRGRVVMVHFWATWCVPCREELPALLARAQELARSRSFELIAVSVDDDWDEIRRFFGGTIPLTVVRPHGVDVHRRFGASTLPDTYLVDAEGRLVERYAGARDWQTTAAREHLVGAVTKHIRGGR